jgi:carbamoyltransferase
MLILGFTGGTNLVEEESFDLEAGEAHESAAVLVDDGHVVAGIEQQRLDRIKHSNKFPIDAIKFCLQEYGVRTRDVHAFVYATSRKTVDVRLRENYFRWSSSGQLAPDRPRFTHAVDFLSDVFTTGLGEQVGADRMEFVPHQVAQLVSAFAWSGYDEALLLSFDGIGEDESGRVAVGANQSIETLERFEAHGSIGHLQTSAIRHLGLGPFDGHAAMGLAPYGNPARFRRELARCYTLLPCGDYATSITPLLALFDSVAPRRTGTEVTQDHLDLAAAIQEALEAVVFHVLRHYRESTGLRSLCLAGAVAHNCLMNGKIAGSGLFDRVCVQSAAHGAGRALGAALASYYEHREASAQGSVAFRDSASARISARIAFDPVRTGAALESAVASPGVATAVASVACPPNPAAFAHSHWGTDIGGDDEVRAVLERWREWIEFERVDRVERRAAEILASGSVIGWVQGRSEFGSHALGNRSILADPRPVENRQAINAIVKKRDGVGLFAASALEESVRDFFDLPWMVTSPSMTFIVNVRLDKRHLLGGITHVDGTARVQTVSREANPRYWTLVQEFNVLTGVPIVLNTSFNNDAEPIVDSVTDAVVCFLTTNLHYLVAGDYVVRKKGVKPSALRRLVASVPRHLRVVNQTRHEQERRVAEYSVVSNTDGMIETVSQNAFNVLRKADGRRTVDDLLGVAAVPDGPPAEALLAELSELWARRVVALNPR